MPSRGSFIKQFLAAAGPKNPPRKMAVGVRLGSNRETLLLRDSLDFSPRREREPSSPRFRKIRGNIADLLLTRASGAYRSYDREILRGPRWPQKLDQTRFFLWEEFYVTSTPF